MADGADARGVWSFLGAAPTAVVANRPGGFSRVSSTLDFSLSLHDLNELAPAALTLEKLAQLENLVRMQREAISARPGGLNELRISPVSVFERNDGSIVVRSHLTDYATYRAARFVWESLTYPERVARTGGRRNAPRVDPLLSGGFGVSIAAVTSDGQLVVTRRGGAGGLRGRWQASISEGSTLTDLALEGDRLVWDPTVTFRRGLHEELGVGEPLPVTAHSLVFELESGTTTLLGHCLLPISFPELLERVASAPDAAELEEVVAVPWDTEKAPEMLVRMGPWAPWGAANVTLSLGSAAGLALVRARGMLRTA